MTYRAKRLVAALLAAALCFSGTPLAWAGELAEQTDAASAGETSLIVGAELPDATAEAAETDPADEEAESGEALSGDQSAGSAAESTQSAADTSAPEEEGETSAADASAAGEETETLSAAETDQEQQVITGFGEFDANANSLTIALYDMPTEAELKARMPETLEVYLDGAEETVELPVEWFCLGDEYGDENVYLFQFSPQWPEGYVLAEGIDLYTEAPYILVYVSAEAEESISVCATVSSNSDAAVVEQQVFQYLRDTMGYNTAAACGVMANIYAESAFIPNNVENGRGYSDTAYTSAVDSGTYTKFVTDSIGYGLCQWTYWTFKKTMLAMAQSEGVSIGNLNFQLRYLKKTLSANDSSCLYNGATINTYMKKVFNSAAGAIDAAEYWCRKYENPSNVDYQAVARSNSAKSRFWPIYKNYTAYSLKVTLGTSSYSYDGSAKTPAVTVYCGDDLLTEGTDYTVSYTDNVNAGLASAVVTGLGTYSGSRTTQSFTIRTTAPVLRSTAHAGNGVTVKWDASPGAVRYRVFRKNGTGWTKVGDTTGTQLTDTAATKAGSYTYTVRCISTSGAAYVSDYDSTGITVKRLASPTLTAAYNSSGSIRLAWKAVSGATRYRVFRKLSGGSWVALGETQGLSYQDKTVQNGKTYLYTVRCIDEDGVYQSGHEAGTTVYCLSAPQLKSAVNRSGRKVAAAWTKNSAAGGYIIRYQTGSKTKYVKVRSAKTLKKTLRKLKKKKTYVIAVRAYKKISKQTYYSAWSNTVNVVIKK